MIYLVINPFDALKIVSFGFPHVGALLGKTLNDEQVQTLKELKNIEKIFLIHPEPENLVIRLSQIKYVRYSSTLKINELSKEELLNYLNSPTL
jgi:hypothetical protein